MNTTVSKEWLEGEAASKSRATCSGSPYLLGTVAYYDWWKGFYASKDVPQDKPYDFKSGQPMTQQQFETEMDAITPASERQEGEKLLDGLPAHVAMQLSEAMDDYSGSIYSVSASARQEDGNHYTKLAIQPMAYSMANKLDPLQHSVVKYITRFRDKNGLVDLRKAIHCIELLIEHETKKEAQ
jgi:hypothetical protein